MALYHSTKGPVDYTVVGNPTIVDGIASGFSSSDYLQLNLNIPLDVQIIEIYSKITTPTVWHTGGYTGTILARTSYDAVGLTLSDAHQLQGKIKTNNTMYTIATDEALSVNTTYYVKYVYNKNAGKLSIGFSTDNQNWIEAERSDISSEGILVSGGNYRIGQGSFGYFRGSIDLNNTYIKVNGQPWFGICPIEVKKHQIMGPVGYTVVGSPTITDGVVSGFSANDYLTVQDLPLDISSLHFNTNIKVSKTTSFQGIVGIGNILFEARSESQALRIRYTDLENQNQYIAYALDGYVDNSTIEIDFSFNNDTGTFTFKQGNLEDTYTVSMAAPSGTSKFGQVWQPLTNGSIDLNHTYIKVNGKLWFWQPAPTKYIIKDNSLVFADQGLYLSGPVNYTVEGSPTITDGVVSGFGTTTDFLYTNYDFPNFDTFESVIDFTTGSNLSGHQGVVTNYGSGSFFNPFYIYNGYLTTWISSNGTSWDIASNEQIIRLNTNTRYRFKVVYENNTYNWYQYDFGTATYGNSIKQISGQAFFYSGLKFVLGNNRGQNSTFLGSIELNQTYIKVNNELWFYGKNYATKNIAPVHANYTYGTTTTSAIGYVDMRTQQFTAAPSGATIGRDE